MFSSDLLLRRVLGLFTISILSAFTFVCGLEEETTTSTQRSIIVLKISPNFKSDSDVNWEYIRKNFRQPSYSYPERRNSRENEAPRIIKKYPYEIPYKPVSEDLQYHTSVIIYFIAISVSIVAIGVISCLFINKCKACNVWSSNPNCMSSSGRDSHGSRSSISVISPSYAASSSDSTPYNSNNNVNNIPSASPISHIKVVHDLPPSYASLFPEGKK